MIGALVSGNIVKRVIVLSEKKKEQMEKTLNCEIVDAKTFGLQMGDLRTARGWTRNVNGEQTILQPLPQKDYDTFAIQTKQIIQLQEQQPIIAENTVQEVLDILTGEVEE